MEINESDLKIEFYRGSGPGGQHRNTTDSAVRIRHLPTGIVAHASESRSQLRNREVALERLKAALVRRDKKQKSRVPTTASRAEKERRLQAKKLTSRKKSLRKHVEDE